MGHAELELQSEVVLGLPASAAPPGTQCALRPALARMPILDAVASGTLGLLAGGAERRRAERGACVFARDSNPTGLFFVLSGSIKLLSLGPDNRPRVVELFEPGDMFGEIGVFTGTPYRIWTQAITPADLIHVDRRRVLAAVNSDHALALRMLTAVAQRTQRLIDSISCTSPSAANVRVAAYLLELADRSPRADDHVLLPAPKGTIASLLNLSQESLSRVLRRMMDAGLLKVAGRRIRIQDRQGLIRMLDGVGGAVHLV